MSMLQLEEVMMVDKLGSGMSIISVGRHYGANESATGFRSKKQR
jgi:hypothetical protein